MSVREVLAKAVLAAVLLAESASDAEEKARSLAAEYVQRRSPREWLSLARVEVREGASLDRGLNAGLAAVRTAVADYMRSEGCTCREDVEVHGGLLGRLVQLLDLPLCADGSGYDFVMR